MGGRYSSPIIKIIEPMISTTDDFVSILSVEIRQYKYMIQGALYQMLT